MIIRTRVFELIDGRYSNLSEVARAMGISVSQIYRVRAGERHINQKFITGAIRAFPEHRFEDLFYLAPDLSDEKRDIAAARQRHMAQELNDIVSVRAREPEKVATGVSGAMLGQAQRVNIH